MELLLADACRTSIGHRVPSSVALDYLGT